MYEPQEGTWTLTAPDGRQWTGASGLKAAAAEQRERIPPAVQLERIFAELEPTEDEKDAARYRWLRERLMAADFDWQESGECALVFAWPKDCAVSGNCDATIDGAMLKTQNGGGQRGDGGFISGDSAAPQS